MPGIIDDYYGGYENLSMFTNYETGEVDYESAYNFANDCGDYESADYQGLYGDDDDDLPDDPEVAEARAAAATTSMSRHTRPVGAPILTDLGIPGAGNNCRGRCACRRCRALAAVIADCDAVIDAYVTGGGAAAQAAAAALAARDAQRDVGQTRTAGSRAVPGWSPTGKYTLGGKELYAGSCSSCGEPCMVPFRPVQGRSAPCCRSCHGGRQQQQQQQQQQPRPCQPEQQQQQQ